MSGRLCSAAAENPFFMTMAEIERQLAGGGTLFCKGGGKAIMPREAHNYFQRALRVSKWRVLKGWHVFRHSFISALASKGVDQRLIDDMVGHQTEEQRRRYRHLYPDVKQDAIRSVFGDGTHAK
jgi:integrase